MASKPVEHGKDWTLLYVRRAKGGNLAIAQLPVGPETDLERLATAVLPSVIEAISRRPPWKVAFVDQTPDLLSDELWTHPEASARYIRAMALWVSALGRGARGLGAVHALTLETCAQCLLGDDVPVDVEALDLDELEGAVRRFVEEGVRPRGLVGCGRLH